MYQSKRLKIIVFLLICLIFGSFFFLKYFFLNQNYYTDIVELWHKNKQISSTNVSDSNSQNVESINSNVHYLKPSTERKKSIYCLIERSSKNHAEERRNQDTWVSECGGFLEINYQAGFSSNSNATSNETLVRFNSTDSDNMDAISQNFLTNLAFTFNQINNRFDWILYSVNYEVTAYADLVEFLFKQDSSFPYFFKAEDKTHSTSSKKSSTSSTMLLCFSKETLQNIMNQYEQNRLICSDDVSVDISKCLSKFGLTEQPIMLINRNIIHPLHQRVIII